MSLSVCMQYHEHQSSPGEPSNGIPLSQNQIRARNQTRNRGRFAADSSVLAGSVSSRRRRATSQLIGSVSQREQNTKTLLNVLFVSGDVADFIPACVDNPLMEIFSCALSPGSFLSKRVLFALSKNLYLTMRRIKHLPRRNVYKGGRMVAKKTVLFTGYRLPDAMSPSETASLRRALNILDEQKVLAQPSVTATLAQIKSVLRTYNTATKEYENYPRMPLDGYVSPRNVTDASNAIGAVSLPNVLRTLNSESVSNEIDDDVYVKSVVGSAHRDEDYIALKKILSPNISVLVPSIAKVWSQDCTFNSVPLPSVEALIVKYASESEPFRKQVLRENLERFTLCLMRIRKRDRLPLMLKVGRNPPSEVIEQHSLSTSVHPSLPES